MAFRPLVEADCGAANPLVQWTSHFTQNKIQGGGVEADRLTEITRDGSRQNIAEQMVGEFLREPAVPQTYRTSSLLNRVQTSRTNNEVEQWVSEFSPVERPVTESTWIREFTQPHSTHTTEEQQWVDEFQQSSSIQSVAQEMSSQVTDPDIQATEFMEFVRGIASGDTPKQEDWSEQFERASVGNGGFWSQLEKEWSEMSKESSHPWLSDYQQEVTEYSFHDNNPLASVTDPLAEGLKKRSEGDLPSAVLLFEAEVQARPDSVQGWLYLGTTQADNEQDISAIAALHQCLSLEPGNLEARLALAVSYTNESQQSKAIEALREWIQHNPKYSHLAHLHPPPSDKPFTGSLMTREEHASVRDLFLAAAQSSPDVMDHHVQVGLGVLFNLSHEYDKAVDCFTAALNTHPQDAMLWNKLGATLANGGHSEEAIAAYRKALEIVPGFTRCRYNLGVSCINLGAHREAVEHLLTALAIQREGKGHGATPTMSESVWNTLRLATTFLGSSPQIRTMLEQQDLDGLIREFQL